MQTDKFLLGQVGIREGDIVPHLSVIPQLQVTAPACTVHARAAILLPRFQNRARLIHVLRDLNILDLRCFPLHCSELARAFSLFLLRDSSFINHSIWQEQVFTSWLVPSAHLQMRWVFFHSSDEWLCEERRCGCSGKICQPPSLRQKLLGWGSSSWLCPSGGQNLCWVTPEGISGLPFCSSWGRISLVGCLHWNDTFRRDGSGTLRCVYTRVSFFAYLAFSILCLSVRGCVFREMRADCWLALQPDGALLWKTCIPQILLKLHSAKWFVIPGWKALLLLYTCCKWDKLMFSLLLPC